MPANEKLSIAVPTYNREDILDFFLQTYVPILRQHNIAIYISNNASTDDTLGVVEKWKNLYPYVYCSTFEEIVHVDFNVENAMKQSQSEYTWLIGDGYEIPQKSLETILEILSDDETQYDFIVTNVAGRINDLDKKVYTDRNEALEDLGWITTCLGSTIFHKDAIQNGQFDKYRITGFCHVGVIFHYITKPDFKIYWAPDAPIVTLKSPVRKQGWGDAYFDNLFEIWPRFLTHLPDSYSLSSKEIARRTLLQKSNILNWRYFIILRAQGVLTREKYKQYKDQVNEVAPDYIITYMSVLTFLPTRLCAIAYAMVDWTRRKNYQIRKALNPDLVM